MRTTQLHITLEQLNNWSVQNDRAPSTDYNDINNFINTMEICPPPQLTKQLRRLVVDEGVNPDDILIWINDEVNNEQYPYNIRLADIFKLVYTPVVVDKSILDGLI